MRLKYLSLFAALLIINFTSSQAHCSISHNTNSYDADDENSEPQTKRLKQATSKDYERGTLLRSLAHQTGNSHEFNSYHVLSFSDWTNDELSELLGQKTLAGCLKDRSSYWRLDQQIKHEKPDALELSVKRATPLIPPSLEMLLDLKALKAWNAGIVVLPTCLSKLTNLQRLELNGNKLKRLPSTLGNLKKLSTLWVYNNSLRTLPAEILELQSLTNVWISGLSLNLNDQVAPRSNLLALSGNHRATQRNFAILGVNETLQGNILDSQGQDIVEQLRHKNCHVLYNPEH